MIDAMHTAVVDALESMNNGPKALLKTVNFMLDRDDHEEISEHELADLVISSDPNSPTRTKFHQALAVWDSAPQVAWGEDTEPRTHGRRDLIVSKLGLSADTAARIGAEFPVFTSGGVVIVNPEWEDWYDEERRRSHSFYWDSYRRVLEEKLDVEALTALDDVTTDIVSRLADPSGEKAYQSKGLVVGHVQSGKTTNFTGVLAKAVDSGYRLVIILTGTVELLRRQTQRRLDMELVGRENILGGRDENDPDALVGVDYAGDGDRDWERFVSLGLSPTGHHDIPSIRRLTTKSGDYKSLQAGLSTLDFRAGNELDDPAKGVWHPDNVHGTDVRLAVVKKNKSVLTKLVRDLKNIHANLGEIPVLILDDEADQASVNTASRKAQSSGERTAINKLIAEMMDLLKRSQYVGYTATPFANVFISPDDSEDVFPKDFIVSLEPPVTYMGGKAFHDLGGLSPEERVDPAVSNEAAHVRNLVRDADDADEEIVAALDMFVLTGAIKLWRAAKSEGNKPNTRHHTMLVHESVKQVEHAALADQFRTLFGRRAYSSPRTLPALEEIYTADIVPVTAARAWGTDLPEDFRDLVPYIGEAVDRIMRTGDPITIVNGDKESEYNAVDFDRDSVWRILVGGTKLSRGFTVESLTITYYRRRALAADTLMQMGRWFGYRHGYNDLVRLYIGRNVTAPRGGVVDLYDAFGAIVQDEEDFRDQLKQFAERDEEGVPRVRPIDVPPLVFQQLPWLRPTASNKMYNAELGFIGEGGKLVDFTFPPLAKDTTPKAGNFGALSSLLVGLGKTVSFGEGNPGQMRAYDARTVRVGAEAMLEAMEGLAFYTAFDFEPHLQMIRMAMEEGTLVDWEVVVPYLRTGGRKVPLMASVDDVEVPLIKRNRREGENRFSGSSPRQRAAIEAIAGNPSRKENLGDAVEALRSPTRGAMLLTFAHDPSNAGALPDGDAVSLAPGEIATLFSIALPYDVAPNGRVGFRARKKSDPSAIISRI